MLSVTILSVSMLNVVMLSVMAPYYNCSSRSAYTQKKLLRPYRSKLVSLSMSSHLLS
jgi:hypothetical protein